MSQNLIDAFMDMREEDALRIANEMLDRGTDPMEVLEACKQAMEGIGQRFECGDAFVPELIMASEMMGQISAVVKPRIKSEASTEHLGKVLIGTVTGDIHDIGKDIVAFMLDVNGFDVYDLGVDVPVQTFVDKIQELKPNVVGLSGLLTLAFDSMKNTVQAISEAGLRDQVKIMIGGATMDEQVKEYVGADAYGPDAVAAVSLSKQWVGAD